MKLETQSQYEVLNKVLPLRYPVKISSLGGILPPTPKMGQQGWAALDALGEEV